MKTIIRIIRRRQMMTFSGRLKTGVWFCVVELANSQACADCDRSRRGREVEAVDEVGAEYMLEGF